MKRFVRMGIDVGGTHTKAVAIDNATHEIIGKSSVKTTHDHLNGVAAGVVQSFQNCLQENQISPDDVVFVAHSTTQATNALIEGDVAKVGVIGMSKGGLEGFLAKRQTRLNDIDLGNKKKIEIVNAFLPVKHLNVDRVAETISNLEKEKAEVLVSSMAFGVDNGEPERVVYEAASCKAIPTTMASDITKLYGLTRRTRTAAINASILPKMLDTATSTENSVREAGVNVSLMIMRGDGGVMEINEMKKRPVLTMLSGPAASVMGSLMYLRASNGVYFEVGGTTTNIGVIKNGRPAIDYSIVGGHPTYISSLDVRVLGVAGGSMVRANQVGIIDVGPRSAHIAGLDYAVFTPTEEIKGPKVVFFSPKEGDPADYVKVVMEDGQEVTITNTCAANVLGLVQEEHFSYGNGPSARKALQVLADYCQTTVEDIAEQIMAKSYAKIEPVILELAEKYHLEKDQISLVGVGGGAASLITYFSNKMGVKYSIPENAEVISSIGVALAMVRDVVERIIPSPSKEDIRALKNEAMNKAIESGATPESIEIHVEIDPQTSKVTAIATGSTEVKATDLTKEITLSEALELAAEDMRVSTAEVEVMESTPFFYVVGEKKRPKNAGAIRIVDQKGFIKVQRGNAACLKTTAGNYLSAVEKLWEEMAVYQTELIARPEFYLCLGARISDFTATDLEQLQLLMDLEISTLEPGEEVIVVAGNIKQT
ncbi:hydantoinase/oxoprolinase family protein [Enterococcus durans]|uniref:Hydantoinase/oxoprolinase family protein n=4 Tax=Enterococcus TaxID=1350 RepID=A0A5N0YY57_9ENTE|nr:MULTISPECIES: hydantoinase/oxoprolinase family protein [Enterococcus]KAA9179656.1 hydantoinase/oxoprolinase family protein [Enterococcus durans]KAA9184973.1 hydantoinase/oxoprolinase family protein [Enterococcus durans]KAA9185954.1 hydantoinase/oxoprolinase family protein [Enterococcus durans]KAA9190374.1 hydantoinase/oxoprolinase family protein [Enterococcus durans]KAA9194515.1 hydantoinase/oxoprolinase family protein [Enterococcus durans]